MVPLENLLLESDGPWSYGGEFAGHPTTPALVARVATEVAQLKGVAVAAVHQAITANIQRVFGREVTSPREDHTD
jgi:TatD DNase family protein